MYEKNFVKLPKGNWNLILGLRNCTGRFEITEVPRREGGRREGYYTVRKKKKKKGDFPDVYDKEDGPYDRGTNTRVYQVRIESPESGSSSSEGVRKGMEVQFYHKGTIIEDLWNEKWRECAYFQMLLYK